MANLALTNDELKCILILTDAGSKLTDTVCGVHLSDLTNRIRNHLVANGMDLSGLHGIPGIDREVTNVKVEYFMNNKVAPIKLVRELTGWGLQEAHNLINNGLPDETQRNIHYVILEGISRTKFNSFNKGSLDVLKTGIGYRISEVQ